MSPDGIVRVRGENWSATSLNGEIAAGGAVQVVNVIGVRLQVWGEENMADRHLTGPAAEPPGVAAPPAPRDSASVIERSSNEPGTGGVLQ
jgi:hypothetical protein